MGVISKKKIKEILISHKLITEKDLKRALAVQKEKGGPLSKILIKLKLVSAKDLMLSLGKELNIPPINLSRYKITPEILKIIPEEVCRKYQLIPLSLIGKTVTVAVADPLNVFTLDDVKLLTRRNIETVISTPAEIEEAINRHYRGEEAEISEIIKGVEEEAVELVGPEEELDLSEIARLSKEAPIVKMVNFIVNEALKRRASDIHLEPYENRLRLRYRIDGALREFFSPPKKIHHALVARIKIMSRLDITQRRLPQDGRFKVKLEGKEVDFRVSVLPIRHGEKIVMRALDKSSLSVGLENLGFLPDTLAAFKKAVASPYGMILVTGPTGSGKSTTLYSVLSRLNTPERNIITIEDPVEYQVEGITQIQVRPEIGLTFAAGLRSLLRQSPDIIMVGEIRDHETADTAIKASLTGVLAFSTLHTNDAAGAITRLIDMGVEPFLISSSIVMAAAQRLCRKICPRCREEYHPPDEVLKRLGGELPQKKDLKIFRGKGCDYCSQTGYRGRIAILEALTMDEKIRGMVVERASSDEIEKYAHTQGMRTLRENVWEIVTQGTTTLEEMLRITSE